MKYINKQSKTPLYIQLMDLLIDKIENYMDENEKLDSEREICEQYKVSRTTVRQALNELEKNKFIYKVQGKGNFISSRRVEQKLIKFYSFTDEMKKLGKVPSSTIMGFEIIVVDKNISKKLKLENNDLAYKITRVRVADNIPMIYEVTYLPYERFKGIRREDLLENPMYEVFKSKFNTHIVSAEEKLEPILTDKLESIYLGIDEGQPSLKIERITYEYKIPIEYTLSIARGDKFKYRVNLKNE